jgi:Fe-S cluster biogenesis protein NfuA
VEYHMTTNVASIAEILVAQFNRMVRRDGGSVSLLSIEGSCITVAYRPGEIPQCTEGVCVMPHVELQALMAETLTRRHSGMTVRVVLQKAEDR